MRHDIYNLMNGISLPSKWQKEVEGCNTHCLTVWLNLRAKDSDWVSMFDPTSSRL